MLLPTSSAQPTTTVDVSPSLQPSHPRLFRWQRSRRSLWARRLDIFSTTARLLFYIAWDNLFDRQKRGLPRRAQWLTQQLLDLGPTFIKIGQALSTRVDLLPLPVVAALSQLQDKVPGFSVSEAIAIVEAELSSSILSLYREFDPIPIAAASLGQVHKAVLHSGEEVVVKVQRPGLEELFAHDLKVLRELISVAESVFADLRQYKLGEIYNEFFDILYREIDYIQEAKNAERFRENFAEDDRILIPGVFWRYTTSKVLTMEYLPGIKITDRLTLESCGIDVKSLNNLGIYCYLKQLLEDGFFQADPHPGNMAVTSDGKIIFYDFGMMAEVKSLDKEKMVQTFFAVLRKDTQVLVSTLIDLGLLERRSDMTPIHRMATFILNKFTEKPVDIQAFDEMRSEIYDMFEQQPFRMPPQMTFILKSLTTLDGIARVLDPEYNLVVAAQPFVKKMVLNGRGNLVGTLARQTQKFIQEQLQKPQPMELALQRLETRLEQGELQIRTRSQETERLLRRLNLGLKSLIYTCWTGLSLVAGVILLTGNYISPAIALFVVAGFGGLVLIRSLIQLELRENWDRFASK
jgi:predicted unusual protein kinase regulating ubiquinone biosynthesis (AarF/ABC1/UbiB family)